MKRITVLLAEDHQIVREGFRSLLKHERDIEVVGEAETGRQAVQLTRKLRPAVVVMDIAMPLLNGLEATRQIRKEFPDTKVLILSAHSDDEYIELARATRPSPVAKARRSDQAKDKDATRLGVSDRDQVDSIPTRVPGRHGPIQAEAHRRNRTDAAHPAGPRGRRPKDAPRGDRGPMCSPHDQ